MKQRTNLIYDFQRRAYDTDWWVTLAGAPIKSGASLTIPTTGITTMSCDFVKGNLEMELTIPTAPGAGDVRKFGWMAQGQGAYAYFEFDGEAFKVSSGDGEGHTQSEEITWNTDWTNVTTLFQIRWDASGFTFLINGGRVAKISDELNMPRVPLSPYISNETGGDTIIVQQIGINGAQEMFHIESNFDEN